MGFRTKVVVLAPRIRGAGALACPWPTPCILTASWWTDGRAFWCRAEEVRARFEKYGRVRDVYLPRELA